MEFNVSVRVERANVEYEVQFVGRGPELKRITRKEVMWDSSDGEPISAVYDDVIAEARAHIPRRIKSDG